MSSVLFAERGVPSEQSQEGRRSPIDMACDILRILSEGQAKPTHILQKANMNWISLSSQLDYLSGRGIIEKVGRPGERNEYRLTLKGKSILQLYEGLKLSLNGLTTPSATRGHQAHNHRSGGGVDWNVGKSWTYSTAPS